MGKALKDGYREKVFLMTKLDGRTKGAAMIQTDYIDLMQHHEIIRMEDLNRVFASGGANAA